MAAVPLSWRRILADSIDLRVSPLIIARVDRNFDAVREMRDIQSQAAQAGKKNLLAGSEGR